MNVPDDYDVVLALDMDEVMQPGWRKQIEQEWEPNTTSLRYPYVFSWKDPEMTIPNITMYNFKIHKRHGFVWKYPVHEILEWVGEGVENEKIVESIKSYHYQDLTKPRPYQKLLDDAIKEYPNDQRIQHLRGRELFMYNRFDEAIEQLKQHLKLTESWFYEKDDPESIKQTRSLSMRYISRCLWGKIQYELSKNPDKTIKDYDVSEILIWNLRQVQEFPWGREQWVWLQQFWYMLGEYQQQAGNQLHALTITSKETSIENEDLCWGNLPINLAKDQLSKLPKIIKDLGIELENENNGE